jgi:ATP-dependent Clp protease protease subunit
MPLKPHYTFKHHKKYNKNELLKNLKKRLDNDSDSESEHDKKEKNNDNVYCRGNDIYFQSDVSDKSVLKLIKIINQKNDEYEKLTKNKLLKTSTPSSLYLHITSYGGDLFACFRAIDAIKGSIMPINTIVDGYAASAGTLMSVVGHNRYMTPNSYMLIHQLSSGAMGTFWQIKDEYVNLDMIMNDIYEIYIKNTKLSRKQLEEYLSHDSWWKLDKCSQYGLIDEQY